jgi:hypothetical protein
MYCQIVSTATNAVVRRSALIQIRKNKVFPGYRLAVLAAFAAVIAGSASAFAKEGFRNSASVERLLAATSSRAQAVESSCVYQYHGGPKSPALWTCR